MVQGFSDDTRPGVQEFPTVGCEIELRITPARRLDIGQRLDSALPTSAAGIEWTRVSSFHRTTDNGIDFYWHHIETHNNRVPLPILFEFGERFAEIDEQLNIERVQEEDPELFEDTVESLGRQRALELFSDIGGSGAQLVRIGARVESGMPADMTAEVLLRVDVGRPIEEEVMQSVVGREFMGQLLRVERADETAYLLGGSLTANIEQVREVIDFLDAELDVAREESAVVCRAIEK